MNMKGFIFGSLLVGAVLTTARYMIANLAALYLHHRYSLDLDLFTENPTAIAQVPPTMRAIASRFGLRITFTRTLGTFLRVEECASKQFGGLGRLWHSRADEYSTLHTGGVSYLRQGYEV